MTEIHGHLLVVDDNRTSRLKLALGLKEQGHQVDLAEEGQQALAMVRAGAYDVVLLDLIMPGMDGFQVLEQMKGDPALRDIPVIIISAVDELDSVVRCIEIGAEDYLPKNFDPVLLRARLNASLQKKSLRDLEKKFLQQEATLHQNEKLATLGRLSAGMAHELNNPAAAVQRGAAQLQQVFTGWQQSQLQLSELALTPAQTATLLTLDGLAQAYLLNPVYLDTLARSDHEAELETWLEQHALEQAWEAAPVLVNLGLAPATLTPHLAAFTPAQARAVLNWLVNSGTVYSLAKEVGEGARRISELVKALKSYTYLDQGPIQTVDVHDGLENTLIILRSKLMAANLRIERQYAADLPPIEAHGSELNQVWTNLIDNAIDALNGQGTLTLRTRAEPAGVVVEVEDSGPGIPAEVRAKIFDPFFTTKPLGQGTGLGLSISYNIVTQKHQGEITLISEPGQTRFVVRLPRRLAPSHSA